MKNFIFISPNFPTNYWMFCRELKNNGMNVLGIGDQPYEELNPNLKDPFTVSCTDTTHPTPAYIGLCTKYFANNVQTATAIPVLMVLIPTFCNFTLLLLIL